MKSVSSVAADFREKELKALLETRKKEDPVALKAKTIVEEEESAEYEEDKDMALITRRVYNFYKKKYKSPMKKGAGSSKITCYECNKPGHIKSECPQLRGGKEKRRSLLSTWSDDDFPDEEEEAKSTTQKETANFCLMAKDS
ncbi:zf-CCHC domain-containing protein/UBN2 domain-containing protein [Senna tora]|uniref:Zf-CCHC domain-containing protein/UBN2 domain-containing protein n=1 Tax=Senna tora TaxID=362788 RepID=A0A834WLX3_9FABA|nr:zf-CCHC domain-containing protein/UBN2 domain-containing protein [Senna tora]